MTTTERFITREIGEWKKAWIGQVIFSATAAEENTPKGMGDVASRLYPHAEAHISPDLKKKSGFEGVRKRVCEFKYERPNSVNGKIFTGQLYKASTCRSEVHNKVKCKR